MCFVCYIKGWKVYLPYLIAYRAQVPILYPTGTRNPHDRASLHTLVCAPRRHVFEEEASDVSIGLQCKPDRDGHVTRRAWDRLLLRHLLAPLLARGSVWLYGRFLQGFHRSKRTRMLSEPNGLVGYLAAFWRYLISIFKLHSPRANLSSQHKYATCITIVAWWCQYAIYLLHFPLLSHDAPSSGLLRNSTFLLTMTSQDVLFHLLVS